MNAEMALNLPTLDLPDPGNGYNSTLDIPDPGNGHDSTLLLLSGNHGNIATEGGPKSGLIE